MKGLPLCGLTEEEAIELFQQAHLYRYQCRQLESKYMMLDGVCNLRWSWEDCKAAHDLLVEALNDFTVGAYMVVNVEYFTGTYFRKER